MDTCSYSSLSASVAPLFTSYVFRFRVVGCGSSPPSVLPVYGLVGFSGCCFCCAVKELHSDRLLLPLSFGGYRPSLTMVKRSGRFRRDVGCCYADGLRLFGAGVGGPLLALRRSCCLVQSEGDPGCVEERDVPKAVCVGTIEGDGYSDFAVMVVVGSAPRRSCCPRNLCYPAVVSGGSVSMLEVLRSTGLLESSGCAYDRVSGVATDGFDCVWYSTYHPWSPVQWI